MNREKFEADFLRLLERHQVESATMLYQDGDTLCIRATGSDLESNAGAEKLATLISEAIPGWQPIVQEARQKAADAKALGKGLLELIAKRGGRS